MILIVGSTGTLGMEICRRLRNKDKKARGLVRVGSPKQASLEKMGVDIAHGDLKDPATIEKACQGVECVVSTANAMLSRREGDTLKSVDQDGQLGLVKAAEKAGVRHFVFISVSPSSPDCAFIRYKRSVEKALRNSSMTWTVLQPGGFMETAFSALAGWDLKNGKVRMVGAGQVPHSVISLHDVAEFAVLATEHPKMKNRTLPLGGPDAVTAMGAKEVFEELTGKTLSVQRAPAALLRIMSVIVRPFNPPLSMILTFVSHQEPDVIDMTPVTAEFPVKLTSFQEFAEKSVREAHASQNL